MNDQQISEAVTRVLSSFGGASAAPVVPAPVNNKTVAKSTPAEDQVASLVSQILGESKSGGAKAKPDYVPSPTKCGWERADKGSASLMMPWSRT